MYAPLNYDQINVTAGTYNPSPVKSYNNKTFWFWFRSLLHRAQSTLIFNGLPEEWEGPRKDFFLYCLFRFGYLGCFDVPEYGKSFQPGGLMGYDFYYQPTTFLLANPLLNRKFTIGEDCEILKLTPDYMGVFDIIEYYAEKLSTLDNAINMSLINSKFALLLFAKNKAAAAALKKALDLINKGEPAVVLDKIVEDESKEAPFTPLIQDLKNLYLTTEQLQDFQTIINNFDAEIGIPTVPYFKKERMGEAESQSRQVDSTARCTVWLECLRNSLKKVNSMLGTTISVELRFPLETEGEEVEEDGKQQDNLNRI